MELQKVVELHELTLYMIFEIFHEGEFVKIRGFNLVIIFVIFPQKCQCLKMKVLKLLGIQPTVLFQKVYVSAVKWLTILHI